LIFIFSSCKNELNNQINNTKKKIKHYTLILEVLEKQIPKEPLGGNWCPALCPNCKEELSESEGDGYYKHSYVKVCKCGQKLKW
jgi:hypothetical protein